MKKKVILALTVFSLIGGTIALSGCGNNKAPEDTPVELKNETPEFLSKTQELETYMSAALEDGKITQDRMDEFNEILGRIEEISQNPDNIVGVDETNAMKEVLANMASQVAAPNELIDYFLDSVEKPEAPTEAQGETSDTDEDTTSMPIDIAKLITDFTNLQNEASKKVDTGEISEEQYFDLLSKGIEIAQIKEEFEAGGATEELETQAENIKPYLYDIAVAMGSSLSENFK